MSDVNYQRLRTHRANIGRYQKLLATRLTDLERAYIERRLSEEQASVETLLRETFSERLRLRSREEEKRGFGHTTDLEVVALLHPGDAFSHPMDVIDDCDLTTYEKRAILSSWAADACAVKDVSASKQTFDGAVSFDDIVDALAVLDRNPTQSGNSVHRSDRQSGGQSSEDAPSP